jgi:hypothetical protein
MKTFSCRIQIQASPEVVWNLLTDAPGYPEWNTTVDKVEGVIALGQKVRVFAKVNPGRAFPVKVTTFTAPHRMVWAGGMPLGLFQGERTFSLTPSAGGVEFSMVEVYSGLLSPLIAKSIPDLQPVFKEFAQALKNRAESAIGATA